MRKLIVAFMVAGVIGALVAAPAFAGKKKTVSEDWSLTAAPLPMLVEVNPQGCLGGVEGVHKISHAFTTPGKGMLDAKLEGFQGDWDLYILDGAGTELASAHGDQLVGGAPALEQVLLPLAKGQEINLVSCNWAGGPTAAASLTYTYK